MRSRLGGGLKIPLKSVRIGYKKREDGGGGGAEKPPKKCDLIFEQPLIKQCYIESLLYFYIHIHTNVYFSNNRTS